MRTAIFNLLIFSLAILTTSCSPIWELEFWNDTGQEVVVIKIHGEKKTRYAAAVESAVTVPTPSIFQILRAGDAWDYRLPPIPKDFWQRAPVNRIRAKLRINKDGEIYLLSPKAGRFYSDSIQQPAGFPLKPRRKD